MDSLRSRIVSNMTDFLNSNPLPPSDHFSVFDPPRASYHVEVQQCAEVAAAGEPLMQSEHGTAAGTCEIEVCARCFACSRDKVALWRHVREVHGDDRRLRCPEAGCGRRFSSVFASTAHRSHHVTCGHPVPYTCELCGRLSPDRSAFDRHVATEHRDARDAMCGVCGRYAGDARSLEEHVDAAHGLQVRPELAVATCKTAGTERTRERHLRYAPYVCGKRYGSATARCGRAGK